MLSGRVLEVYELSKCTTGISYSQLVDTFLNGLELFPAGPSH